MGKNLWILSGLVVAAIVIYFTTGGKWGSEDVVVNNTSPGSGSITGSGAGAKPVVKNTGGTSVPTSTKSYTEYVKEYEGRRIQFDDRCQVIPQNPTYKNGTSILLDNRSASARTVLVGGTKYDLVAYGYRVVTLSSSSLPKELAVSCGSSGNVGKILLQATILQ